MRASFWYRFDHRPVDLRNLLHRRLHRNLPRQQRIQRRPLLLAVFVLVFVRMAMLVFLLMAFDNSGRHLSVPGRLRRGLLRRTLVASLALYRIQVGPFHSDG